MEQKIQSKLLETEKIYQDSTIEITIKVSFSPKERELIAFGNNREAFLATKIIAEEEECRKAVLQQLDVMYDYLEDEFKFIKKDEYQQTVFDFMYKLEEDPPKKKSKRKGSKC